MENKFTVLTASSLILLSSLTPIIASANVKSTGQNSKIIYSPRETNLIQNGDFSHGSDGWEALVDSCSEFALIDHSMGDTATTHSISVEKNSKYRLTFDLKNSQISQLDCEVTTSLGNISETNNAIVNDYNSWQTFSFDISSYDFTSLKIKFAAINTLSEGGLDNVKLVKIS